MHMFYRRKYGTTERPVYQMKVSFVLVEFSFVVLFIATAVSQSISQQSVEETIKVARTSVNSDFVSAKRVTTNNSIFSAGRETSSRSNDISKRRTEPSRSVIRESRNPEFKRELSITGFRGFVGENVRTGSFRRGDVPYGNHFSYRNIPGSSTDRNTSRSGSNYGDIAGNWNSPSGSIFSQKVFQGDDMNQTLIPLSVLIEKFGTHDSHFSIEGLSNSSWVSKFPGFSNWFSSNTKSNSTSTPVSPTWSFSWFRTNKTQTSTPVLPTSSKSTVPERSKEHSFLLIPDVSNMRCFPGILYHSCAQLCYEHANSLEPIEPLMTGEQGPSLDYSTATQLTTCLNDCRSEYVDSTIPGCVTKNGYIIPGAPSNNFDGAIYPDGIRKPGTFSYYFNRRIHRFFEDRFLQQSLALLAAATVLSGIVILIIHQSDRIVSYFPAVGATIEQSRLPELCHWLLEKAKAAARPVTERTSDQENLTSGDVEEGLESPSAVDVLAIEARRKTTSDSEGSHI